MKKWCIDPIVLCDYLHTTNRQYVVWFYSEVKTRLKCLICANFQWKMFIILFIVTYKIIYPCTQNYFLKSCKFRLKLKISGAKAKISSILSSNFISTLLYGTVVLARVFMTISDTTLKAASDVLRKILKYSVKFIEMSQKWPRILKGLTI